VGTNQLFGSSVALSADSSTLVIGAAADSGGGSNVGATYVFTLVNGVWTQKQKLIGTGNSGNSLQGTRVAVSSDGSTIAVGGPFDAGQIGAVWIFTGSGGVWTQQGSKLTDATSIGSRQGTGLALSADGNTVAWGGPLDSTSAGATWVYTRSNGSWSLQQKLVGTGAVDPAQQGSSAALSADGNTLLAGGYQDNAQAGASWVFTRSGTTWTQQGSKLVGTGAINPTQQGVSVGLSADGNTAIIGGNFDNSNAGAFWIFTRSGGVWTQQGGKLVGTGAIDPANQGSAVALSGDGFTALDGGRGDNSNAGATWVFYNRKASTVTLTSSPTSPSPPGQEVTFTATVTTGATGTVTFNIDGTDQLPPVNVSNNQASFTTSTPLTPGVHTIIAKYSGDSVFAPSNGTLTQTVKQLGTVTLTSSPPSPSQPGQLVTFTAQMPQEASGSVTFNIDGTDQLPPVNVSNSQASFTTATPLTPGSHAILAKYSGDSNFGSGTGSLTQIVKQTGTVTLTAAPPSPSVVGQPVTFTATMPQGAGGTVTFNLNGTDQQPPVNVSNSQAVLTISNPQAGTYNVFAKYSGDSNFGSGTSNTLTQNVIPPGATTLTANPSPSLVGQAVVFTATVPQNATGTVTFNIDGTDQQPPVNVSSSRAQLTYTFSTAGNHPVVAKYSGDSNFGPSNVSLTQTVTLKTGTTSLTSNPNPSLVGQSVTFTTTVPQGGTGTVTFNIDGTDQQPPVNVSNSQAQLLYIFSTAGNHPVVAKYSGDSNFGPSTASLTQVVAKQPGTTTLTTSTNPSVPGQTVTFTATVPAGATGIVTFSIDGAAQPPVPVAGSQALFATASLALGTHAIVATYSGDPNFSPASGNLTQAVSSELSLSSSANPSQFGRAVTFTAIVPQSATGSIQFTVDGIRPQVFPAPVAQFTTSTLTVGSHTIGASYSGDANFPASSGSLAQIVFLPPPLVSFTSSTNPSVVGQPVTFTATLNVDVGVSLNGLVMIVLDGSTPLGTATVSGSSASFTTQALTAGSHVIVAKFVGFDFQVTMGQVVYGMTSTTTVSVTPTAPVEGLPVTLVATMGPAPPPSGFKPPTGQVMFEDNGLPVGTATILSGTATLTLPSLPAGTHQITGVYLGDKFWNSSFGRMTVTVAPAGP
jgi:hypothetical protein